MQTETINVKGMTCGHCKSAVEGALNDLDGVSKVDVDLDTGKVEVAYDETKVSTSAMNEAIEDQGYDVVA